MINVQRKKEEHNGVINMSGKQKTDNTETARRDKTICIEKRENKRLDHKHREQKTTERVVWSVS